MLFRILSTFAVCLLCFAPTELAAQKARFKNTKAACQKTRLPSHYVEPDQRTYDLYLKGKYSENVEAYTRGIYGWSLDSDNPNMEAVISLYGFRINSPKRESKKRTTKDRDGKVTDSWTEYTYSGSAVGKGTLYVYGRGKAFKYKKLNSEKSRSQLAREAEADRKAAAEKEAAAANPFLSAEDVETTEDKSEVDEGIDAGLDDAMIPLARTYNIDVTREVSTKANRSSRNASKDYWENHYPKLKSLSTSYPNTAYKKAIGKLNARYGYSPVNHTIWLKKMKSDKHPDYQMWNDACVATRTLFKPFRYNKSIAEVQPKFGPIVDYFVGKANGITDKDRKGKNMKKAAFNNAANILFYLDRFDDLIALCEANGESKFVGKAARKMMHKANRQRALMEFHKVDSYHLEAMEDLAEEDIEVETTEADPEDDAEGQR